MDGTTDPDSSTSSEDLRSYVDELTKDCDTFRILVCGKSGVGKTSLVSEVFDFEKDNGTSEYTPGQHDIDEEITSPLNKRLILHDSRGLESGSSENLETVRSFLEKRRNVPLVEQVHAIWYCVQIPTAGERPFETGDQELFQSLLGTNNVPLIVVFTKFDKLQFRQRQLLKASLVKSGVEKKAAMERAKVESLASAETEYKRTCVDVLESNHMPKAWTRYCKISIKDEETITNLIELTKSTLSGPQSHHLNVLWATAQRADLDLNVSTSLKAGKNLYWHGLAANAIPLNGIRRITTLKVLSMIHKDVVSIWNFSDPDEVLKGANFRRFVRSLFIEPLISPSLENLSSGKPAESRIISRLAGFTLNPGEGVGAAVEATAKTFDEIALTTPATARVLMAYVADLTLGMESLFWLIKPRENKVISETDVLSAYMTYFSSPTLKAVHAAVTNYIGDEEVFKAFNRQKAHEKVVQIVEKNRFNPTEFFKV